MYSLLNTGPKTRDIDWLEHARGDALCRIEQAEENVFRADIRMAKAYRLLSRMRQCQTHRVEEVVSD